MDSTSLSFKDVSIILPVINETNSLVQTIDIIMQSSCSETIKEFIIVIADKTTDASLCSINNLIIKYPNKLKIHRQTLSYLGGALRESFMIASGSHTLMMASDLETDPYLVCNLILQCKSSPGSIVTVNRWAEGGGFANYSPIKLASNWIFQKFFSALYKTNLGDMTYGYRIFPTKLLQMIKWEEIRHPFLFETILKPLRLGVHVVEIPGRWKARVEGSSQNSFFRNFEYFKIGFKVRFMKLSDIII